jgi:multidrug efflux pump subunit AcrA (membrane-fusion protein)
MRVRSHNTEALEKEALLMPADVPARVATWTGWLLLAVFAAAVAFACTVRLPETFPAAFVIEPGPAGAPVARLSIPESAFPRLTPGQVVRLRYNAYPSQRYGSTVAVLQQVSPAAQDNGAGSALSAIAIPKPGPAGHAIQPQQGMRGEARILIARRTLLAKLITPSGQAPD